MSELEQCADLEQLAIHNRNLVMTAFSYQARVRMATSRIGLVLASAKPISGQSEDEPSEYVVPAEDIEGLREVLAKVDPIMVKRCYICGSVGGSCPDCGG